MQFRKIFFLSGKWILRWKAVGMAATLGDGIAVLVTEIFGVALVSVSHEGWLSSCIACVLSHVWLFDGILVTHQASLSMGFLRQVYWSGLPFPTPGNLPDPRIEPTFPLSPLLQADSLPLNQGRPWLSRLTNNCESPTPYQQMPFMLKLGQIWYLY